MGEICHHFSCIFLFFHNFVEIYCILLLAPPECSKKSFHMVYFPFHYLITGIYKHVLFVLFHHKYRVHLCILEDSLLTVLLFYFKLKILIFCPQLTTLCHLEEDILPYLFQSIQFLFLYCLVFIQIIQSCFLYPSLILNLLFSFFANTAHNWETR